MSSYRLRLAAIFIAVYIAMYLQFTLIWGSLFDVTGLILAGFLTGPVILLFISIEQSYSRRHKH